MGRYDVFGADPFLDVTVPETGDYLLKVWDMLYRGSEQCFYRIRIGAVPYLGMRFPRAPVYATPFAAGLIAAKLEEAELEDAVDLITKPLGSRFKIGPFDIEYVTVTHSIPEPNALLIRTRYGTVL